MEDEGDEKRGEEGNQGRQADETKNTGAVPIVVAARAVGRLQGRSIVLGSTGDGRRQSTLRA
jgi:hypothetical protein